MTISIILIYVRLISLNKCYGVLVGGYPTRTRPQPS
jgi:hypothetical protein